MITINYKFAACFFKVIEMKMSINNLQSIILGREKDGGVKTIEIDCSEWKEKFPQLTKYRIEVTSPNGIIYCPEVTMNEHILTWLITKSDTTLTGKGEYQIVATGENGERLTSAHLSLHIYSIMSGTAQETPPEYIESWVQNIVDTAERADWPSILRRRTQPQESSNLFL